MNNKKLLFPLILPTFVAFSCAQGGVSGSNDSSQESSLEIVSSQVPSSYTLNDDGSITIKQLNEFVFEYDKFGDVVHEGVKVDVGNATLSVHKAKNDDKYTMKVNVNEKYDLDQFIINKEVIKYRFLDCHYKRDEGKYYEYILPSAESYTLKARITTEKTKSLIGKDEEVTNFFKDKQYSILGDSISTFQGISNNTDYNSTIAGNAIYYPYSQNTGKSLVQAMEDTYWGILIEHLGLKLCVNNSSAGGFVQTLGNNYIQHGCMEHRCHNLHNDHTGVEPEIITVYLGINDFGDYCDHRASKQIGTFKTIDDIKDSQGAYKEGAENTFTTAYAMMIDKVIARYPNAKIYVSNLLGSYYNHSQMDLEDLDTFNKNIQYIANYFGIGFVDMAANFKEDFSTLETFYEDTLLHPNMKGMKRMAQVFENEIIKDITYRD